LYEKPGFNKTSPSDVRKTTFVLPEYFSCKEFDLTWWPQSIKIEGELIVVLTRPTGESEIFTETKEKLTKTIATKLTVISGKIKKPN